MMEMPAESTALPKTFTLESPGIRALSQPPQYGPVLQPAPTASKAGRALGPCWSKTLAHHKSLGQLALTSAGRAPSIPQLPARALAPRTREGNAHRQLATFWFGIHRKFSICRNLNNLNDKDYHSNVVTTASPPPSPSALSWKKLCLGHAPAFQRALPARAGEGLPPAQAPQLHESNFQASKNP